MLWEDEELKPNREHFNADLLFSLDSPNVSTKMELLLGAKFSQLTNDNEDKMRGTSQSNL
jgi:hypothetical protein